MKKIAVFLILITFVIGLAFVCNDAYAARKKKDVEAKEEKVGESAAAGGATQEAKLVCKFKGDEEMTEFEQLYVSKQATFGRMGVLQAYFAMEQNNLVEIDRQMEEKFGFKMDPSKMYDLNRDAMEIRELGPVAPAQPAVPAE